MPESLRLIRGGPLHLGVNYRLHYGYDFANSDLSVANPNRLARVHADFAELARHEARILRWFLWNDGRTVMSHSGPLTWNRSALRAGLDAAAEHGLSVLLVLLDHTFCFAEERDGSLVKQGFGLWIKEEERFARLLEELLQPAIAEAGAHAAVMGFEFINEPEMAMRRRGWWLGPQTGVGCEKVPPAWQLTLTEMRTRMRSVAALVHRVGKQFSVGSMSSRWVGQWEEVLDPAADFLNFHYYGEAHERDLNAMIETRILPLAERIAIGFGEFYPCGARVVPPSRARSPWPDHTLSDFFRASQRYRLQLAMPWVWNPGSCDPGQIPMEEWAAHTGLD